MPARQRESRRIKTSLLVLSEPRAVSAEHKIGIAIPKYPPQGINPGRPASRKPDKTNLTMTNSRPIAPKHYRQRQELSEPNKHMLTPAPDANQYLASKDFGGAGRDRTDDILLAKQALSQLSYGPNQMTGK